MTSRKGEKTYRQIERERVCGNAMRADITRDCYSEGTERCCYSPDDEGMSREIHSERAHRPAQDRQDLLFDRFPSAAGWMDDDISCPHHQPVTSPAASTTQYSYVPFLCVSVFYCFFSTAQFMLSYLAHF